jgi:hypothetical protein
LQQYLLHTYFTCINTRFPGLTGDGAPLLYLPKALSNFAESSTRDSTDLVHIREDAKPYLGGGLACLV